MRPHSQRVRLCYRQGGPRGALDCGADNTHAGTLRYWVRGTDGTRGAPVPWGIVPPHTEARTLAKKRKEKKRDGAGCRGGAGADPFSPEPSRVHLYIYIDCTHPTQTTQNANRPKPLTPPNGDPRHLRKPLVRVPPIRAVFLVG